MITEDYVSFETAKLLKEKGFDEYTETCFVGEDWESPSPLTNSQLPDGRYSRPTLQMTMKWLKEVHNIFISIFQIESTTVTMEQEYFFYRIQKNRRTINIIPDTFKEPEQACEAAIKYCLKNLI